MFTHSTDPLLIVKRVSFIFFVALALVISSAPTVNAARCDHTIAKNVNKADGRGKFKKVSPGDTVCIAAGTRGALTLSNFQGKSGKPITFINNGGRVDINAKNWAGLIIENSQYVRITGTGSSHKYGIVIHNADTVGMFLKSKSQHYEVDHIEIYDINHIGIHAKTKQTCPDGSDNYYDYDGDGKLKNDSGDTVNRKSFTQNNSVFHHNYLHKIGTEGFYIGANSYNSGHKLKCKGGKKTVFAPALKGVQVHHNIIDNTGWDAIQVASAIANCNIHHNQVLRDSQKNSKSQTGGIRVAEGSQCNVYNNLVKQGKGPGIIVIGKNSHKYDIYNNVLVKNGLGDKKGNNVGTGISVFTGQARIWNNTIVQPKTVGIKYRGANTRYSRIENNLVVAPGNSGKKAYVDDGRRRKVGVSNNLNISSVTKAKFKNPGKDDYGLKAGSPAIDAGKNISVNGLKKDFVGTKRPQGKRFDVGAYERK